MTVKEFLKETYKVHPISSGNPRTIQSVRPRILCRDGFTVSIQAGEFAYSIPRLNVIEFESVELGFPSESDELIMRYINGFEDEHTNSCYAYVPIEIVEQLMKKHGGIVGYDFSNVDENSIEEYTERF